MGQNKKAQALLDEALAVLVLLSSEVSRWGRRAVFRALQCRRWDVDAARMHAAQAATLAEASNSAFAEYAWHLAAYARPVRRCGLSAGISRKRPPAFCGRGDAYGCRLAEPIRVYHGIATRLRISAARIPFRP